MTFKSEREEDMWKSAWSAVASRGNSFCDPSTATIWADTAVEAFRARVPPARVTYQVTAGVYHEVSINPLGEIIG